MFIAGAAGFFGTLFFSAFSTAATTSIFFFLNNPKNPPILISFVLKMTASLPSSLRMESMASGIESTT